MKEVVGRTLGVIHRRDGSKIDGQFFTLLFFGKNGIKSFQLVQRSIDILDLFIVKSNSFSVDELESILDRIRIELPSININLLYVDRINLTSTGKIMYVYSEL
jgi:phenylacetate-CoA ligase